MIALMTSAMKIDGHRADLVVLKAARANAAFQGRKHINRGDILLALELAIPHRLKRGPFADTQVNISALENQMDEIEAQMNSDDEQQVESSDATGDEQSPVKKKVNR